MSQTPDSAMRWSPLLFLLLLWPDLATCQSNNGLYKFSSTPTFFQGFWPVDPTSVEQINCANTRTWTTSGSYGACCVQGSVCTYYTGCNAGTVTRMDGSFWTCSSDFPECFTMTVYASTYYDPGTSKWLVMGCGANWRANTVYREILPTAPMVRTVTAGGSTVTLEPTFVPPTAQRTLEGPSQETAASGETTTAVSSRAWIAGAVIGPLAALAAMGGLFVWLRKRRAAKNVAGGVGDGREERLQQEGEHAELYAPPQKHEMPVFGKGAGGFPEGHYPPQEPPLHEMPEGGMEPQELPGSGVPEK